MCHIKYSVLQEKSNAILEYCLKYSNSFSLISNLKRPYSQIPPVCAHNETISSWTDYLINYVIGIKEWPGTITRDNHRVMYMYNSRKFRTSVYCLPNFFSAFEDNLPEDICFYRDGKPWLFTVSHEKLAGLWDPTPRDIAFFDKVGAIIR